jgi:hypothetical protein
MAVRGHLVELLLGAALALGAKLTPELVDHRLRSALFLKSLNVAAPKRRKRGAVLLELAFGSRSLGGRVNAALLHHGEPRAVEVGVADDPLLLFVVLIELGPERFFGLPHENCGAAHLLARHDLSHLGHSGHPSGNSVLLHHGSQGENCATHLNIDLDASELEHFATEP